MCICDVGMVSSNRRDGSDLEVQLSEYGEVTLSRKRRKVSELVHRDVSSSVGEEHCHVNAQSSVELNNNCLCNVHNSLSGCDCGDAKLNSGVDTSCQLYGGNESISRSSPGGTSYPVEDPKLKSGVDTSCQINGGNESISRGSTGGTSYSGNDAKLKSGIDTSCQLNGGNESVPLASTKGTSYPVKTEAAYASSAFVNSWMYVNAQGQMCGPYIQEQLYEGLSSGFLPDDLPVYPIMNGSLMNPVPLNYFRQFPDHVATGFAYLSGVKAPANSQTYPGSDFSSKAQDLATNSGSYISQTAYPSYVNLGNVDSNPQDVNTDEANLSKPYMPVVIKPYLLLHLHLHSQIIGL